MPTTFTSYTEPVEGWSLGTKCILGIVNVDDGFLTAEEFEILWEKATDIADLPTETFERWMSGQS